MYKTIYIYIYVLNATSCVTNERKLYQYIQFLQIIQVSKDLFRSSQENVRTVYHIYFLTVFFN